jgi:exosortase K
MSTLFVLCLGLIYTFKYLNIESSFFVYPTGKMVSLFCGGYLDVNGEGCRLMIGHTRVLISSECSGTSFFCILFSFIAVSSLTIKRKVFMLVMSYPITLISNSFRVISAAYCHQFIAPLLPDGLSHSVHMGVGVIVYLTCLSAISYFIYKIHNHVRAT